mgnify:CR=1 FL=1
MPIVFNFVVPFNAEDYIPRIGRTGRAGASGLAVSFVSPKDARLVSDIEKLLKSKIELEAVEFDEDTPDIRKQGRINDGRRMYEPEREAVVRRERASPRDFARPVPLARDPFFDKPYEAPATVEASPSWDATTRPGNRISSNIKPKRKVAALLKYE